MPTYPYVQARYDFGPRKGPTLGLMFHGAEAEAGVVGYLSRDPARNVSANFVCERSGRMVQMLPLDHASGSLNPKDRSTDKAYYGHSHLVDVLESWWTDPNSAVISVEIEMYARKGPNAAQVASLIDWAADMRQRFPTIVGALGHADQTDTKGCPGSTAAMKSVFTAIGGHGLFGDDPDMRPFPIARDHKLAAITTGAQLYLLDLTPAITVSNAPAADSPYRYRTGGVDYRVVDVPTGGVPHLWLVKAADCALSDIPAATDCTDAIAADRANARIVWS